MPVTIRNRPTAGRHVVIYGDKGALTILINRDHRHRYLSALVEYALVCGHRADRRWEAVLYLLTMTPELWKRGRPKLDYESNTVELDSLVGLDSDELKVLTLVRQLFAGNADINIPPMNDIYMYQAIHYAMDEYSTCRH